MSPIINPDTSAMTDMGPIAAGTYPAEISAVTYKNSKAGNPMLEIDFSIEVSEGVKRPRKSWAVITGEGAFNFDQLLRATGFHALADQYKDKNVSPKPSFDTDMLIGQKVNVVVEGNLYNNEMRDQIKSYLPI
jgi:hypothetical protein